MKTLVLRLSGPEQSWGEQARFLKRTTMQAPTFSGIIGLLRACLGHGREQDYSEVAWLYELEYAIRIDQIGSQLSDYHTINPRKPALPRSHPDYLKERKTLGTVPTGSGKPWIIGKEFQSLITERYYRQEAVFLCFISGEDKDIEKLIDAVDNPKWQLSLGRKRCLPDWTLYLGYSATNLVDTISTVPTISIGEEPQTLEVHFLNNRGSKIESEVTLTYNDRAVGSHPNDGYIPNTRILKSILVPTVKDRQGLLEYAKNNLNTLGVNNE